MNKPNGISDKVCRLPRGTWRKTCKIKSFKVKEAHFDKPGYTIAFMDKAGLSYDHYSLVGIMREDAGNVRWYEAVNF